MPGSKEAEIVSKIALSDTVNGKKYLIKIFILWNLKISKDMLKCTGLYMKHLHTIK
jgi:hypothetical protein